MVIVFLLSVGACEFMSQSNIDGPLNEQYMVFEQNLNEVFVLAGEKLGAPDGSRYELADYFRSAYVEVFADEADITVFDRAIADMVEYRHRKEASGLTELLISISATPEEALGRIAEVLAGDDLEEEQIVELLVVRQSIHFMMEYHELLEPEKPAFTMSVMDGEHNDEGDRGGPNEQEDDGDPDSWWTSWGSCAAGMIGSAGDGALKGCGVGFVISGPKGCAVGATIGAVVGAIGGAADYC